MDAHLLVLSRRDRRSFRVLRTRFVFFGYFEALELDRALRALADVIAFTPLAQVA